MENFKFIEKVDEILLESKYFNMTVQHSCLIDYYLDWSTKSICEFNSDPIYNVKCPDIYAGEGEIINGNVNVNTTWFDYASRLANSDSLSCNRNQHYKTIVIILESPHADEYNNSCFINPALGKTGKNLQKYFGKLIKKLAKFEPYLNSGQYRIILMESIQYQCSLGIQPLNIEIRDLVFSEIWNLKKTKDDFRERLSSYHPDIILNLCTKGKTKKELRKLVQESIDSLCKNKKVKLYRGGHPSGWYSPKNRYIIEVNNPSSRIKF